MNLRDLRYVVAVADHGHFGRAARICAVSQPTLSGQILKLEKELGVDVFERVGKAVRLTLAGAPIVEYARRVVTAADDMVAFAAIHRDPDAAPLRLGIIPTLAPYLMPIVLPVIREALPQLHLTLVEDLTARLIEPLLRGELDAALIACDVEAPGLREDALFDEPFWLVMPMDHVFAGRGSVPAGDVEPGSLLLLQDGHCLRDQALDLCQRPPASGGGVPHLADMRATSLDTLLQMADAGYGLTLMPHLAIVREVKLPKHLVARRLSGEHTSRRVRLVSRPSSARRATIDLIGALVRGCVPPVAALA